MKFINGKISVIIPVYQSKNYLKKCIESILNQTYNNVEIILVDDGSNDGSEALCDDYAEQYDNILCVHQVNKGVSSARNRGIRVSMGQYILFVDSDDYIETDYLENAIKAFEEKSVDMYLGGYQAVRNGGRIQEKKYYPMIKDMVCTRKDMECILMELFQSSTLHAIGTKIYKRTLIEKYGIVFKENWKYYEDIYFCLNYLVHCKKIYIQGRIVYYYQRDITHSLSKQIANFKYENIYKTYSLLYKLISTHKIFSKYERLFYEDYLEQISLCLESEISVEKRYTVNIRRLYKKLSGDLFYIKAMKYASKYNKNEYFCIQNGFYFLAYFIRNYLIDS